mmetsp:Transcript_77191/g.226418  ORF Transcript_77191/g.226418 Transcript_77191/m.226418 type:complete len:183 (+) Transcript_77191:916-1464(+)
MSSLEKTTLLCAAAPAKTVVGVGESIVEAVEGVWARPEDPHECSPCAGASMTASSTSSTSRAALRNLEPWAGAPWRAPDVPGDPDPDCAGCWKAAKAYETHNGQPPRPASNRPSESSLADIFEGIGTQVPCISGGATTMVPVSMRLGSSDLQEAGAHGDIQLNSDVTKSMPLSGIMDVWLRL